MREIKISKLVNWMSNSKISKRPFSDTGSCHPAVAGVTPLVSRRNSDTVLKRPFWIFSKSNNQSSKSTSSKRNRRERGISSISPHSEFLGTASTFSGLALALLFALFGIGSAYAVDSSITISLSGAVNLNLMGGDSSGVFGESTAATASVETNNYSGYTFTITGGNNNGALVGTNDASHTLPSITGALTKSEFDTATYNNKWGFLPSKLNSIANTKYQPSPTLASSATIDVTEKSNVGNPNDYTLAIAARVDGGTPNDRYTGSFTLAAIGNETPYHIAYTDDAQNMPSMTVGETSGASVAISSQKPFKNGYVFLGWCTVATTDGTCSGNVYQPGGIYTLDATTDNSVTLHAMWAKGYTTFDAAYAAANKTKPSGASYYAMQDMTEDICRTIVAGTEGTLVDTRDNRTYAVSKYADNNCWMHQNLELTFYTATNGTGYAGTSGVAAGSVANGVTTLTNANTDINSGTSVNVNTFKATQNAAPGASTGAWSDDGSDGGHSFSWTAYSSAQAYAVSAGTQNQYGQNEYVTSSTGRPYERGGNLYNWTMATLGSGTSITTDGTNAPNSICPKGWKLPDNSGSKSFYNLLDAYYTGTISPGNPQTNSTIANPSAFAIQQNLMRSDPLNFVVNGNYSRSYGAIGNRATESSFWSATAGSSTHARRLGSYPTGFGPQSAEYRGFGFAVRCVAR